MAKFDEYTDAEYSLHEIVSWAMLGLIDTVNENRPDTFSGFLDDLYFDERGGNISGEPGWSLERIVLDTDREDPDLFIHDDLRGTLNSLLARGEREAFWIDNYSSRLRNYVLDAATFWKIVAGAFAEFVGRHPNVSDLYEAAKKKYPQLSQETD
jgi:hypothetical protein